MEQGMKYKDKEAVRNLICEKAGDLAEEIAKGKDIMIISSKDGLRFQANKVSVIR